MTPDLYGAWLTAGLQLQPYGAWIAHNWPNLAAAAVLAAVAWRAIGRALQRGGQAVERILTDELGTSNNHTQKEG